MIAYPKPVKKPKSKKRRPLSERVRLERELDALLSLYVRKRDGKCVICGATEGLTAGHWIARGKKRLRWDRRNVATQCSSCNLAHNYNPQFYTSWMLRRYGEATVLELTEMSRATAWKWSVVQLREMLTELTEEYERLQ